jgi:transcriptional regulator with XRE-family HTH domain
VQRFGEKLRTLRHKRRVTLEELSRELGYADHTFLSRVERGQKKPSMKLVLEIARRFQVSTDQLLVDDLDV